jgi:tetratricopeptide (TPR) repeat protein
MPEKIEETPLRRISRELGDAGLFPAEVHRLYEAGKARKAQAALRAHIPKELNSGRKRRQQQHLDDTYLWLEPLGKAPTMQTVNGIGTMLYGRYNPNADGLYIATLWFVFVFLPVFPLAAYVVRKAGGNAWTFYAKAPLPPFARIWRWGSALVVAAVIAAIAASVAWDESHAELWVYNGFDRGVDVTVADDHYQLGPRQLVRAGSYPLGTVPVSARPEGWAVPLEELEAELGIGKGDEVLYNIGGRASLLRGWIVYGPGTPPEDEPLGTDPFVNLDGVDYVLRDPPDSKQVREGSNIVDELIYDAELEAPFGLVVFFTHASLGAEHAWRMLAAQLAVDPGDREALAMVHGLFDPLDGGLTAVGELARAGQPGEVEAHRLYQNSFGDDGQAQLRDEYAALALEHPDEAMYQYLAGRVLAGGSTEAEGYFRKALALDPDYGYAHLALGYLQANSGRLDQALVSYGRFAQGGPLAFSDSMRSRLRLLQVQGSSGWRDEAGAVLARGRRELVDPTGAVALQAVYQARYGELEPALENLEEQLLAIIGDPELLPSVMGPVTLDACLAAGDLARAEAVLAAMDPELDGLAMAKGQLYVALSRGDAQGLGRALDEQGDNLFIPGSNLTLLAAAAAEAVDHDSAAGLAEAARAAKRPGETAPSVVLEAHSGIGSASSLDALLQPVPLDVRGFAYAAAAILLEQRGSSVASYAREQASLLLLPDEGPRW